MACKYHSTREREREIKLLPQTHSAEADNSLFIMHGGELVMLERLEKQPGMASTVFPHPIFAGLASLS
jgi:hypothetical protein